MKKHSGTSLSSLVCTLSRTTSGNSVQQKPQRIERRRVYWSTVEQSDTNNVRGIAVCKNLVFPLCAWICSNPLLYTVSAAFQFHCMSSSSFCPRRQQQYCLPHAEERARIMSSWSLSERHIRRLVRCMQTYYSPSYKLRTDAAFFAFSSALTTLMNPYFASFSCR